MKKIPAMMPGIPRKIFLVPVVMKTLEEIPCFLEKEINYLKAHEKNPEHLEFLWKARKEDPDYPVCPPEFYARPKEKGQSPEARRAMEECLAFLGIKK